MSTDHHTDVPSPGGMADPVRELPTPATPGARREVSIVIDPRGRWTEGCAVRGRSRDVFRRSGAHPHSPAGAEISVLTDAAGVLEEAWVQGEPRWDALLRGRAVRGGFRAGLAELDGLDPASPEAGLLDDLPTVRLIAGYALMMEGEVPAAPSGPRPARRGPLLDVCSGWRADGVAVRRTAADVPLLGGAAVVPPLASLTTAPGSFLAEEPLQPRTMRRRRILEISPSADGGWDVFGYLRDSHVDRAGAERGLHEYAVTASADPDLRLRSVVADPRTLPFQDCPLAAPQVHRLVGLPAAEAGSGVGDRLPGVAGCTHLSDLLRTFRFLPRLAALIDRGDTDEH